MGACRVASSPTLVKWAGIEVFEERHGAKQEEERSNCSSRRCSTFHSVGLGNRKKKMQVERKEMEREKICGVEVSASTQDKDVDDVDNKTAVKKKKGRKSKKGEGEINNHMTKNEDSGKSQIEMSDLIQENKDPGLISDAGEDGGQGHGSIGKRSTQKSGILPNSPVGSPAAKPKVWTSDEEIVLLSELLGTIRSSDGLPVKKNSDIDWDHLLKKVIKKVEADLTRTQVYEKTRRLKTRYSTLEQKLNAGALNSFKNAKDGEIYRLSQQIWGHCKTLRLHLEEDDEDPVLATDGKLENELEHNVTSQNDDLAESFQITMKRQNPANATKSDPSESGVPSSKVHEKKVSNVNFCQKQKEKPVEDMARELTSHAMNWDAQRMLEIFQSEHHSFVKEVQDTCHLVLEEMQFKLVTMVNNVVKEAANQFPPSWMGGMHLPSFTSLRPSTVGSPDDLIGNFIAANRLECAKPAIENLQKRWQQQRLEELKLTSGRLRLLLDECQMQQERMEREMRKS